MGNNIGVDRVYHNTTLGGGYSEIIIFPNALNSTTRAAIDTNLYNYYIITLY